MSPTATIGQFNGSVCHKGHECISICQGLLSLISFYRCVPEQASDPILPQPPPHPPTPIVCSRFRQVDTMDSPENSSSCLLDNQETVRELLETFTAQTKKIYDRCKDLGVVSEGATDVNMPEFHGPNAFTVERLERLVPCDVKDEAQAKKNPRAGLCCVGGGRGECKQNHASTGGRGLEGRGVVLRARFGRGGGAGSCARCS